MFYGRNSNEGFNSNKKMIKKFVIIGIIAVVVIILLCETIGSVPVNHTGIMKRFGKVQDEVVPEGLFLKIPFFEQVESISNMVNTCRVFSSPKDSNATTHETAETKDRQIIESFDFEIQYQLDRDKSFLVYKNYGKDYEKQLIVSNVLPEIKRSFANYDSEEIVNNKEQIANYIKEKLQEFTKDYGIVIIKVNLSSYDFTAEYNQILEERALIKAKTENEKLRQEQQRVTAQTEYDVAVKNAERDAETKRIASENDKAVAIIEANKNKETALINANALAEADKIKVDNEAYVIKTKAEADKEARLAAAEATKAELEAQASGINDYVIQKSFIEKWDGKLIPSFGGGTDGIKFTDMTEIYKRYLFGEEQ